MKINIKKTAFIMIVLLAQANCDEVSYSGNLRFGTQYHDSKEHSGSDIALGGSLHLEKKVTEGIVAGVTFRTSNALFAQNDSSGIPFLGSDGSSYALLSEVYLQGSFSKTTVTLGRQTLDTPFADSDDVGMVPNTFEAYTVTNHDITNSTIIYSYLRNMSGVDAETPEAFSKINGGSGLHTVGFLYEGLEDTSFSTWFYLLPHVASLWYGEFSYSGHHNGLKYDFATQLAWQDFKEAKSAKVFGLMGTCRYKELPISLHFAYNRSRDGVVTNGFGGGPFFANDEHLTLADVGANGEIMVYGMRWDTEMMLVSGLEIGLYGAILKDADNERGEEYDITLSYNYHDTLTFDAIYSTLDNSKISGDRFDNLRVFAKYSF